MDVFQPAMLVFGSATPSKPVFFVTQEDQKLYCTNIAEEFAARAGLDIKVEPPCLAEYSLTSLGDFLGLKIAMFSKGIW